jgi:hypothetical protein
VFAWSPRIDPTTLGLQPMPGSEIRNWLVEYQAGYVFPETSSTEYGTTSTGQTLPDDIVDAVLSRSREIVQGDANVLSKKVGDLQLTYGARGLARDGTNVRSEFEETLSKYRRVV